MELLQNKLQLPQIALKPTIKMHSPLTCNSVQPRPMICQFSGSNTSGIRQLKDERSDYNETTFGKRRGVNWDGRPRSALMKFLITELHVCMLKGGEWRKEMERDGQREKVREECELRYTYTHTRVVFTRLVINFKFSLWFQTVERLTCCFGPCKQNHG